MEVLRDDIVLSRESARAIDQWAPDAISMPLGYVMENAGYGLADALAAHSSKDKTIVFVCGTGNNGADGFVAARHLMERGYSVLFYVHGDMAKATELFKEQFNISRALRMPLTTHWGTIEWQQVGMMVEGLVGTGLRGDLRDTMVTFLQDMERVAKQYRIPVCAIDMPAGIDATTRYVALGTLHYTYTVTFGATKQGLLLYPGKTYAGQVIVKELGLPWHLPGDDV